MKKSKNKFSFATYLNKLNEIDINILISKLKEINLNDIKNIDLKKVKNEIKSSRLFKPSMGFIGASFLFYFVLYPSIKELVNNFSLANKYEIESNSLKQKKLKVKKINTKVKKASFLISDINQAIIRKEDILFISKLINETAIKSDVELISFLPIDTAKSSKLCNMSNRNSTKKRSRKSKNISPKKGSFQENFFEINFSSNYLDMINFLNSLQNYDVVILPNCLNVKLEKDMKDSNKIEKNNNTNIIPIPATGATVDESIETSKSIKESSYNRVRSRLVLKIPSHSKL